MLSFFGQSSLGGLGAVKPIAAQIGIQALGLGVTILWSATATLAIALVVKVVIGLRVTQEKEYEGMDLSEHGESAYQLES